MMTIAVDIRSGEDNAMELLECVAFLLIRSNTVLLTTVVEEGKIAHAERLNDESWGCSPHRSTD
jgi:hypothetical protein